MKVVKKIINDTLKNKHGKWSRKSLTMFTSFVMAIILGSFIVISDKILKQTVNPFAIQVFFGFLALSGGTSALTVWDKFKNSNDVIDKPNDAEYE